MNLRWLVGNFADPEFNLTPRQQRAVTDLAHRKYLSRIRLALWTIVMVIVGCVSIGLGWDPLSTLLVAWGVPSARLAALVLLVASPCVASAWLYQFIYRRPVRLAMRELGYDICVSCGYRLQGLDASITRCPECGAARPQT